MVDDVQDILEPHQHKEHDDGGLTDPAERVRVVRERREAEQRRRLDELRAHAAAAQAQREQRDAERRRRADEQRAREDDRRQQVEERKRAIWEAGVSRREALLRRDREREERVERQRAARSCGARTNVFAFGSSTPRMLEPADTGGIFWGHRSTNPLDQMNFFESLASSTSNVMFASAPLTRRPSTFDLDRAERDKKDESAETQPPPAWSSVARRRTDLVPTIPAPRPPGRAYSMTRLDRIQPTRPLQRASPSMVQLNRNQLRSGETTPGSRPGSAMSTSVSSVRRPASTPRRPRPASIAGTPRGAEGLSAEGTPCVSRDATSTSMGGAGGETPVPAPRRPHSARRPRPVSMHATPTTPLTVGDGKPPLHRKSKLPKDNDRMSQSVHKMSVKSPSDSSKEPSVDKDVPRRTPDKEAPRRTPRKAEKMAANIQKLESAKESNQVNALEVTQKLEALQLQNNEARNVPEVLVVGASPVSKDQLALEPEEGIKTMEVDEALRKDEDIKKPDEEPKSVGTPNTVEAPKVMESQGPVETPKPVEQKPVQTPKPSDAMKPEIQKFEQKPAVSLDKPEETDMTASMIARSRITTEEEAKAALAERRRKAREELERQAELERQRLAREAEEEVERARQEEERQRQLEEEARELAELQRKTEEEKLRKAIEAQQQLEREARERAAREEAERAARARDDEEERRAREVAEAARREEAEREEAERRARRQRVEAIMLRTRQKKAEEEKKQQESGNTNAPATDQSEPVDNASQQYNSSPDTESADNGNAPATAHDVDLLGLSGDNANTQSHIVQSTVSLINAERNSNVDLLASQNAAPKSADVLTAQSVAVSNSVDLLGSGMDLIVPTPVVNVENTQGSVDLLSGQLPVDNVKVQTNGESKETSNGYSIHNGHKENNGLENVLNNGSQYPLTLHNAV